jgi:hypothetical protein
MHAAGFPLMRLLIDAGFDRKRPQKTVDALKRLAQMRIERLAHERDALKTNLMKLNKELDIVHGQLEAAKREGQGRVTTIQLEEVGGPGVLCLSFI